jgi:hypothetical protein
VICSGPGFCLPRSCIYAGLLEDEMPEKEPETYVCGLCKEEFFEGWSDEEAEAEFDEVFGKEARGEKCVILCDDCYKKVMAK